MEARWEPELDVLGGGMGGGLGLLLVLLPDGGRDDDDDALLLLLPFFLWGGSGGGGGGGRLLPVLRPELGASFPVDADAAGGTLERRDSCRVWESFEA